MTQRNIAAMSADQLWNDWREDIELICKDSYELFFIRRQFREIAEMYQGNEHLQETGGNLWLWLQGCYASTILLRFRREVDTQANTVNLRTLLEEIEKRPDVITRGRLASRNPNVSEFIAHMIDDGFTKHWAVASVSRSPGDQIDAVKVRSDRLSFETATEELDEVVSRILAHRQRIKPSKSSVDNVSAIFDLLEGLIKKYVGLLKGSSLDKVEPTPQYDTLEPFTFPWHPETYAKWKRLTSADGRNEDEDRG